MNCCQAVLCAYANEMNMDRETVMKLGAAFGSGMATTEGTCGALVGAGMVLGMLGRQPVRPQARTLYSAFVHKCGSAVCRELKGSDTGSALCSCEDCVRNAAQLVEQIILHNP